MIQSQKDFIVHVVRFCLWAGDLLLQSRSVSLQEDLGQEFAVVLRLKLAQDIRQVLKG